jgi:hypothetical protein
MAGKTNRAEQIKRRNHPYADLFPMMADAELDALADDIKQNGLRQPVMLHQEMVLDGRNRLKACDKAGVEPAFVTHEGDDASALALVISLNVQRRDLTAGQRALVAARRWMMNGDTKDKGKGRREKSNELQSVTVAQLAREFHASASSISQARDLLAEGPDLAAQVEAKATPLAKAHEALKDRQKEAQQAARNAQRTKHYTDAIANGEMTLEEALKKVREEEQEANQHLAAEKDARFHWWKELNNAVVWIEQFISARGDDHLAWYGEPGSPGQPAGNNPLDQQTFQRRWVRPSQLLPQ